MASLSQAKTLGGIGGILALLFWLPAHVGIVLLIVGLVLMLLAVKNIADTVVDQVIFSNMMYSVVLAIIGPIIATVVLLAAAASLFSAFSGFTPGTMTIPSGFWAALEFVILAGIILWVCILISTVFVKRRLYAIYLTLSVVVFRTR